MWRKLTFSILVTVFTSIFLCIILVARNLRVVIAAVGAPQSTLSPLTRPTHYTWDVTSHKITGVTISSEGRVLWLLWRLSHYHSFHFLVCYNHQKASFIELNWGCQALGVTMCCLQNNVAATFLQTLSCKRRSLRILTLHWHCSFASKYFQACSRSLWYWCWLCLLEPGLEVSGNSHQKNEKPRRI